MLKQRIITALVLIPIAFWLVLFANHMVFSLAMVLIVSLAAFEWGMLCGLGKKGRVVFSLVMLLALTASWYLMLHTKINLYLLGFISVIWLGLTVFLVLKRSAIETAEKMDYPQLGLGALLLVFAWVAIVNIHAIETHGSILVMLLLVMIWIADSAAYFAGRKFGKHKLSPVVSPGKSWEGVAGAFLAVGVYGFFLTQYEFFESINPFIMSILGILVAAVSVGGDLFESKIKRERGVKDSGSLLPGHGGVYDRLDSLIAAAPVYLFGILLITGDVL